MLPKASLLWLNYNSMHVISVTKRSLSAITQLDYPNFELIIVDNGSYDSSREVIEEYVKREPLNGLKVKLIKLSRNWGWTGGFNAGYRAIDSEAEYVALLHNDLIPRPNYLKELIMFLEDNKDVGAVQGIVVKIGCDSIIDSAGFMLDESLNLYPIFKDKSTSLIRDPIYASYVEGTMPVYRVGAVRRVVNDDITMYITSGFIYYLEDVFLSLMLWSYGYKCIILPIVTGEHFRMAVTKKFSDPTRFSYYRLRNQIALLYMTNSIDKGRFIIKHIRRLVLSRGSLAQRQVILNALIDGMRLGKQLVEKYGAINLYKAPIIKTPIKERFRI
jgi:GT2 family glycosyltransferase